MPKRIKVLMVMVLFVAITVNGWAVSRTWDNGGGTGSWTLDTNWSDNTCPTSSDLALINSTSPDSATVDILYDENAAAEGVRFEPPAGETFTLTVHCGGTLTVEDEVWLIAGTSTGKAVLKVKGSTVTIGGELRVGGTGADGGHVQINGGTVDTDSLTMRSNGTIDITNEGKLIIDGDSVTAVNSEVSNGNITAYDAHGEVLVQYTGGKTVVTAQVITADQTTPNPVIWALSDSEVFKYNGEYYIIGTDSDGKMSKSKNLVNWDQFDSVLSIDNDWAIDQDDLQLSDDEIHSPGIGYINGVFHLYYTVNYNYDYNDDGDYSDPNDYRLRGTGHAKNTTTNPEDPMNTYTDQSAKFCDYIDPAVFRDSDGSYYFTAARIGVATANGNENQVWGQGLTTAGALTGSSYTMLTPSDAWEIGYHGRINEAQWLMKYRGMYYMLYSANEMVDEDYAVGCAAQTSGPLSFANNQKYGYPVLAKYEQCDHSVKSVGQQTVLRGPNGFEWWMTYKGYYDAAFDSNGQYVSNSGRRGQSLDRVLFFDRELSVVGPTSNLASFTAGTYTPGPASATFGDVFDRTTIGSDWDVLSGTWSVVSEYAKQANTSIEAAMKIKSQAACNYLVECGIRHAGGGGVAAGVVAYYKDSSNWLTVNIKKSTGKWYYKKNVGGTVTTSSDFSLPTGFADYNKFHNLRILVSNTTDSNGAVDGKKFNVWIDDVPAPSSFEITVTSANFVAAGLPGLYSYNAESRFDGFTYTIGWDEYGTTNSSTGNNGIAGWGDADSGAQESGTWSTSSTGIKQTNASSTYRIYKGDMLKEYEFSTQVTATSPGSGDEIGIYAIYQDTNNWLIASIKLETTRQLTVHGLANGSSYGDYTVNLPTANSYNLRVIRRSDNTYIYVDGDLEVTVPNSSYWGASQVGLRSETVVSEFNGLTLFKLGSQYGDSEPVNTTNDDNFDDGILDSKWVQVPVQTFDKLRQYHDTLPDIVVCESNNSLNFSGCEKGDDSTSWCGRGMKYNVPITGNSTSSFEFSDFKAYSETGGSVRAAIGLRIYMDQYNWFEIRQTDNVEEGNMLEWFEVDNGTASTDYLSESHTSGTLKIVFDNSNGNIDYYYDTTKKGTRTISGMIGQPYYIVITAYSSNDGNRISCKVDNFKID